MAATLFLSADFLHFGASDFPLKKIKKRFKIVFFSFWRRDLVLELQFPTRLCCVLQLSLCRSLCTGCVKVASCCGCNGNPIVFCSWISFIILEWLHTGCHSDLSADFPFWRR